LNPEKSKRLVLSGLFIALGILVPVAFHGIGAGAVFLPMFWPVALSCFFLPISFAVTVGAMTPLLSFIVTGMPPVSPPILQIMVPELMIFSFTIALSFRNYKVKPVIALLLGLVVSRIVIAGLSYLAAPIIGLPGYVLSIGAVVHSIPGSVIILIIIPILKRIIESSGYISVRNQ